MADNETCPSFMWYWSANNILEMGVYYVVTPLYFIFGLIGHVICLMAFYRQVKKEAGYYYQLFLTASETLEIIGFFIYGVTFYWFMGYGNLPGSDWFKSNYGLMWYTVHLALPQTNMLITTSLLLAVSVTVDRIFALAKPFAYKQINRKKHQMMSLAISVTLGIGSSIFDCFRLGVVLNKESGLYEMSINVDFVFSVTGFGLAQFRNALRIFGLVALAASNVALLMLYSKQRKKKNQIAGSDGVTEGDKQRKEAEHTLLILAIFQSIFNSISMFSLCVFYGVLYFDPRFARCEIYFWGPIIDGALEILDLLDFYVAFAFSAKFRKIIFSSIPSLNRLTSIVCCKTDESPVTVMVMDNNTQSRNAAKTF